MFSVIPLVIVACECKARKEIDAQEKEFYSNSVLRSVKKTWADMDIAKEIIFNAPNDTSDVIVKSSNMRFVIHYYKNKPQGVLVQNILAKDSLLHHYVRDNKGVYFILSSIDPDAISAAGFKYLNGNAGVDISVDIKDGSMKNFTAWEQYKNDGKTYDVKELGKGVIKVYTLRDGEKIDSSVYLKQ